MFCHPPFCPALPVSDSNEGPEDYLFQRDRPVPALFRQYQLRILIQVRYAWFSSLHVARGHVQIRDGGRESDSCSGFGILLALALAKQAPVAGTGCNLFKPGAMTAHPRPTSFVPAPCACSSMSDLSEKPVSNRHQQSLRPAYSLLCQYITASGLRVVHSVCFVTVPACSNSQDQPRAFVPE